MTQIFVDYKTFHERSDKIVNGVSSLFVEDHPDFVGENDTNTGCWNCSDCIRCSDCAGCRDCWHCSDCYHCVYCSHCRNGFDKQRQPLPTTSEVPVIKNIHQGVLKAINQGVLDMSKPHRGDTVHCRGGWVVHLAGEKGYALERETSTVGAAMLIYKASSPVKVAPGRFFETNEEARIDIEKCALI